MIRHRGCCWIRSWTNASFNSELRPNNLQCKYVRQKFWSNRKSQSEIQMIQNKPLVTDLPWSRWPSVPPAVRKRSLFGSDGGKCSPADANPYWALARDNQTGIFLGVLSEHLLTPDHAHPKPLLSDSPSSYFCEPEDLFGGTLHLYSMPPWRFCLLPFKDLAVGILVYTYLSLEIWCPGLMDWLLAWFMAIELNPRVGYLCLPACYVSQRVTIGLSRFIERVPVS